MRPCGTELMRPLILMFLGEAYVRADRLEDALACAGAR